MASRTFDPFSGLAGARQYARGSSRNVHAANGRGPGPGEVTGFAPGTYSRGAFAAKLASTILGRGQRLAARQSEREAADQQNYERQLRVARMEQLMDPNYMSAYERGELQAKDQPKQATPRSPMHLTAQQAVRFGVGKTEGDYDPDVVQASLRSRGYDLEGTRNAHSQHMASILTGLRRGLDQRVQRESADEYAKRGSALDQAHAAVLNGPLKADKGAGYQAALKALGLDEVALKGYKTATERRSAVDDAYRTSTAGLHHTIAGEMSQKYGRQYDDLNHAYTNWAEGREPGEGIDWDSEFGAGGGAAPPAAGGATIRPLPAMPGTAPSGVPYAPAPSGHQYGTMQSILGGYTDQQRPYAPLPGTLSQEGGPRVPSTIRPEAPPDFSGRGLQPVAPADRAAMAPASQNP